MVLKDQKHFAAITFHQYYLDSNLSIPVRIFEDELTFQLRLFIIKIYFLQSRSMDSSSSKELC